MKTWRTITPVLLSGVLLSGVLLAGPFIGCSVRTPDVPQQEKLVAEGHFPAGIPAWISPRVNRPAGSARATGIIPQTFTGPQAIADTSEAIRMAAVREDAVVTDVTTQVPKQESPIDRINRTCAGVESDVTSALTTTDITARIGQYEKLTTRCPGSSDLWQWLATDYSRVNNLPAAQRAFEQSLILDGSNETSRNGLNDVVQRINAPLPAANAPGTN